MEWHLLTSGILVCSVSPDRNKLHKTLWVSQWAAVHGGGLRQWRRHTFSTLTPSDHQYANTVLRAMMYKRACLFVCLLQPYLFLRWPPSVHSEQWRDRDRVVSEGPAALETAHVLLLPEQLRGRMRPCALCTHSHSRPDLLTSPLLGGWTRRRGRTKTSHLTNFKICSFPQNSGSVTRS